MRKKIFKDGQQIKTTNMGQIADDMIEGRCCSLCGQYFVKEKNFAATETHLEFDAPVLYEHGYPVACKECWEEDCGYEKAEAETA